MSEQTEKQGAENAPAESPAHRPRHPLRWFVSALVVLCLLMVLVLAAVWALLRSDTGTAWLIDRIPGLETEQASGSLLGEWQAQRIEWRGYGVAVVVRDPAVAWSPGCLFRKSLCLDRLHSGAIRVEVQPSTEEASARADELELPDIHLPLEVVLADVQLGSLTVNGAQVWDRLTASVRGSGADMTLERASYRLDDVQVTAEGRVTMRRDWPLNADVAVSLPPPSGEHWQISANLAGSVRDLNVSGRSNGYLNARFSGAVRPLEPSLPVRLELQTPEFLADPSLPETLTVKDGRVSVRGALADGFRAELKALLPGTTGNMEVFAKGHVTTDGVDDAELTLTGPDDAGEQEPGQLVVAGAVSWADGVSADADLNLQRFPWYALLPDMGEPPVVLEQLRGSATYANGDYSANLNGALQGPHGPADFSATVRGDHEFVRVEDLLITAGDNRIAGSGEYGEGIRADLQVSLPDPQRLLPGLDGELFADLQLEGSVGDPTGRLSLQAADLSWRDQLSLASANLRADLASGLRVSSRLSVQTLMVGDQQVQAIEAELDGNRAQHRLTLQLSHQEGTASLDVAGGFPERGEQLWRGMLDDGELDIPGIEQTWRMRRPATLAISDQGQVDLGGHCWDWQQSAICTRDQRLWPEPELALQIDQFPAASLALLLPDTVRWDASIDAEVNVTMTHAGPEGRIRVDAGNGGFEVLAVDQWHRLAHQRLDLILDLGPDRADLAIAIEGPKLGVLSADLAIDPMAESQPVEGRFSLSELDLSLLQGVLGLEDVQGRVNGAGRLSGPLKNPEVFGELVLTRGRFFDPTLPLPMEDVVVALQFGGRHADISGRWQSNDRSYGQLDGRLDWAAEPQLALKVTGERLPVSYEPYAHLEIEPDLDIAFRAGELSVTGEVAVPRGDIRVRELPESAVRVSGDEMIVGVERPEPAVRSMPMDVTLVVGQDRVTFDAFGVTGDLEGTLRIGNNMDTRGVLQLVNGQYQEFGQDLALRRARIQFIGPLTEPYLDVEAIRTVDTVVAGIRLTGPVSAPETEVFSEPPMPQADALSYLVLGRPPGAGQGGDGQLATAAISLGLTQASKVTQGLGNELGIQELTLETEGSGDQASVVASGYITDELSLRYGVGIFEPITTVALRYELGRYFYLEAASGLAASLDIFYTRDF